MPTLKLQGGLGNQMFEYVLAYSLSQEYNEAIVLDGYFLESRYIGASWTFRHYELDVFGINKDYADIPSWIRYSIHPGFIDILNRLRFHGRYTRERDGAFIEKFPKNAYLDGWFQSYKYFQEYIPDIKKIFTVKTPLSKENQDILDIIQEAGNNAVSLHVRRGDYVALESANKWHGVCSIGYYEEAIQYMKAKLGNPVFFVFSDDVGWCRENIVFPEGVVAHYIDHNGNQGHEDLRLMYSCAHHIIANSSFSWWGAWLGRNPDKIVLAPGKWLQTDNFNTQNLIPPSWILL
ncbi:MAG: alpha-1,2-fucosyltransferase [Candidatus Gracilibacteria bacterium]|nr:alpha-1,2-fucosyltransferase [Candidatus Gracilibacteria bacterium]